MHHISIQKRFYNNSETVTNLLRILQLRKANCHCKETKNNNGDGEDGDDAKKTGKRHTGGGGTAGNNNNKANGKDANKVNRNDGKYKANKGKPPVTGLSNVSWCCILNIKLSRRKLTKFTIIFVHNGHLQKRKTDG